MNRDEELSQPAGAASVDPPDLKQVKINWTPVLLAGAIACCLLLQVHLTFVQPINWDEFRFLADIHAYRRGELSSAMLTFQVHLFGWLASVGDEIQQIRFGRLVMLALEAGTLFFIWTISRRFFDNVAALFAVLSYISFSYVLQHGASFRFDPLVTSLLMGSIALLLRDRLTWGTMGMVGLALALAAMVSIKIALALPLVLAVATYRLAKAPQRRAMFLRLLFGAISSFLFLAILYWWHLSSLAIPSDDGPQQHLAASYTKMIANTPWLPSWKWFRRALFENPLHWIVLLIGIWAAAASYRRGGARALVLLAFLLPLLTITFYRNAFPYFYGFALAPAAIVFAAATNIRAVRNLILLVVFVLTAFTFVHHRNALSEDAKEQRRAVQLVHYLFPKPVPYLDRCSMIGSYPQSGTFLGTWWLENYVAAGQPVMRDVLLRSQPVFAIANSPQLKKALDGWSETKERLWLLEQDDEVLRSNYVHYSGPVWVAGKRLQISGNPTETEFLIGGEYVVESDGPIDFDGHTVSPGERLTIQPGVHRISGANGSQQILFRWAAIPALGSTSPPSELKFGRF